MYDLDIKEEADKIFRKLAKKNQKQLLIIHKKITEIRSNPYHKYKFLRNPLHNYNRIHIDSHFVLIFRINHDNKVVEVYYFSNHDEAYLWRPLQ